MNKRAAYHSPLRQAQAAATREQVLKGCVAVMQTGAELTYSAVAAAAGVQERTVYRYFPTKADLESGLWQWISEHLTHITFRAANEADLIAAMRESFAGFDAGAPLIQAMLHSRQGLAVRLSQQEARRTMFEGCVAAAVPDAPPAVRRRAAAALQLLYSAAAWESLRVFWDMDHHEASATVELAIRSLLAGLRMAAASNEDGRSPEHDAGD
jgi:AcrR family transcriptional regulator